MEKKPKKGKDASTSAKSDKKETPTRTEKNCDECGKNFTHNTAQCWKLQKKNRAKSLTLEKPEPKRTFSNKGFRKEVNSIAKAKGCSKLEVLNMYAAAAKKEQKKLQAKKKKPESSDSKAEMSVSLMEKTKTKKKRKVNFDPADNSDQSKTPEEMAFLKKVMAQETDSEQEDKELSDNSSEA